MTKKEFNAALGLQRKIDRLKTQLETLQETGGLGAVRNNNSPVMGGGTSIYPGQLVVELEQEIHELEARLTVERTIIQRFIDKQPLEETPCKLLIHRYVECMKWKDVALRMGYTKRHLSRVHSTIIENMSFDVL